MLALRVVGSLDAGRLSSMSHGVVRGDIYYKQENEKDRLRMGGGSWSINYDDVDFDIVETIVFCTDKGHYIISATKALLQGFDRILGGERKLVVPVKHWKFKSIKE